MYSYDTSCFSPQLVLSYNLLQTQDAKLLPYFVDFKCKPKKTLDEEFADEDAASLDLLKKILILDPNHRISAEEVTYVEYCNGCDNAFPSR